MGANIFRAKTKNVSADVLDNPPDGIKHEFKGNSKELAMDQHCVDAGVWKIFVCDGIATDASAGSGSRFDWAHV